MSTGATALDGVEVIEGAGHTCNLDRPDEYTAEVDGFVAAAPGVAASD